MSTIRELVDWGSRMLDESGVFYGHGTDNAYDEALSLVLYALELDYSISEQELERTLSVEQQSRVKAVLHQRIETRRPAPYITGRIWFAGIELEIDESALIPRSPIAELIENRFEPWANLSAGGAAPPAILDLCTGSGCIAIACALHLPDVQVVGSDISRPALALARRNLERYALQQRLRLVESDLFERLGGQRFDLIVSNPPYVSAQEMAQLPAEYRHEPRMALEAAEQGLALVSRILQQAADYLTEQGVLVVEVGNSRQALVARYPQVPFTWIEFANGGEGVFTLDRQQLLALRGG